MGTGAWVQGRQGRRSSLEIARRRRFAFVTFVALLILLALAAAPAFAATHRGVTATIGSPGSAAGQLSEPQGVALNRSSNDLYVVDKGNHRVDQFEANGTFIRAWGWGVADGMAALETCTLTCQPGLSGSGAGALSRPFMGY
jgi:DNA-binding beta-propeller fold protein YncE